METGNRPEWEVYGKSIRGDELQLGDRFDRFTIFELLTVSIFGHLYRVKDNENRDDRLLHIFPSAMVPDPAVRARLRGMVERLRVVRTPGLLEATEVIESFDTLAVVYENAPGAKTLLEQMEESCPEGGMPPKKATDVIQKVADTIRVCGELGVRHLALIPGMVLVGPGATVKVYGMGFLECLDRRRFELFVSSAILPIKGDQPIPGYTNLEVLSPEYRNEEDVDIRADLYTIGILSYFLLVHRRPETQWVLPSKAVPELAEGWDFLISRCLEAEPSDRYATVEAFLADLLEVDTLGQAKAKARGEMWRKLDRIPLPQRITRRYSARVLTYVRLAVLGVIGSLSVGTGSLLYVILFTDIWTEEERTIFEAQTDQRANLVLRIDPQRAKVRVIGEGGAQFLVINGELRLRGNFRDYIFLVESPQYEPSRFSVRLDGTVQTREVVLDLAWGQLRVEGPVDARIEVVQRDGRRFLLGRIPETGVWNEPERLLVQNYDIEVTKDGFSTQLFQGVSLQSNRLLELKAALTPLPATLRVVSDPEGAEVKVDDALVGRTPLELADIPSTGRLQIEVSGRGFRPRAQTIEIQPGQENVVDFGNLEAQSGTLALTVRLRGRSPTRAEAEGLTVVIGDESYAGIARLNSGLRAARHLLQVEHPDYFSHEQRIQISDNEETEVAVDLTPRPGKVELNIPERPFRVLVNGQPGTLVRNIVAIPAEEEVQVTLAVKDFLVERKTFYHQANDFERWSPHLVPIPGPSLGSPWTVPYLNEDFVWIERGSFVMGSPGEEQLRLPNEGPQTRIRLSHGFWMGQTEVTQSLYQRVMGSNPSAFVGPDRPVDQVSWRDAMAFAAKLTEQEAEANRLPAGFVYRLPTEAEWAYAARAGTTTPFSFGDRADGNAGNFEGRYPRDYGSAVIRTEVAYGTRPVKTYPPNAWGLYDVHGNVSEWVYDAYSDRLPGGSVMDPVRRDGLRGRTVRGGGWNDFANAARSAARDYAPEEATRSNLGFRLVLAPALTEE